MSGSCVGQLLLDLRDRRVTVARERQERRLFVREGAVVRARARGERLRIGDERVRAELPDARFDLDKGASAERPDLAIVEPHA